MDTPRKGVLALSVLVVPVSCSGDFFSEPVICYFLDAFLIIYCIIVTGFFFREKFSKDRPVEVPQEQNGIYQELERPKDADPYEVLDPSKRKKKAGKKKKRETEKDPFESVLPGTSSPPPPPLLSPH